MKALLSCLLSASLLALEIAAPVAGADLPPEAQKIVSAAKQADETIQQRVAEKQKQRAAKVAQRLAELIKKLRAEGRTADAEKIERFVASQDVPPTVPPVLTTKVEVEWHGTWYPAVVLQRDGNRTFIKYDGYGDHWNEWVGPDRVRRAQGIASQPRFPAGSSVDIKWNGSWYPGKVLKAEENRWFIHYDQDTDAWDEWVGPDRIRALAAPELPKAEALKPEFRIGANVDVEWHGTWYPGKVLKAEGNRWLISYDGYDEDWHEWVGPERIRARSAKAAIGGKYPGPYELDSLRKSPYWPYSPDFKAIEYAVPVGK